MHVGGIIFCTPVAMRMHPLLNPFSEYLNGIYTKYIIYVCLKFQNKGNKRAPLHSRAGALGLFRS
jgi:hypothetical protein